MPYSYDYLDPIVKNFCLTHYKNSRILDVGAGAGKYGKMLRAFCTEINAVEIFKPNIARFKLREIYNHVFNYDLRKYEIQSNCYDLVIMGDVLEHLSVKDAQEVLSYYQKQGVAVLVIVPYNYVQGKNCPSVIENQYEEHLQSDLTPKIMTERYWNLVPVHIDKYSGIYLQEI